MTSERLSAVAREDLVEEVFLAYLQAVDRGQAPEPAALVDGHPEIAEKLRELFADEERLQPLLSPLRVCLPASADAPASGPSCDESDTPAGEGDGCPDGKDAAGTATGPAEASGDSPPRAAEQALPDIPGFEILAVLGEGGMGVVYKVFDRRLKRYGALKMVRPGLRVHADAVARLRAEAQALGRLQHRHIVQVFASDEYDGQPYIVQEFVKGGSLYHRVRGRPQEPREAARLVLLLARAVHAAHGCGLIHRDLKPANVLLAPATDEPALNTAYGCPKVADFGLAKCLDSTQELTATGVEVGTPLYMAPEQARGDSGAVGPATDVWALGAMLYELLTGQVPFHGRSKLETLEQIRSRAPEPPRRLHPEVPPGLEAICLRCLEKSLVKRYPSAAALAEDLSRWLEGRAAPRPPRASGGRAPPTVPEFDFEIKPDQPPDAFLRRCWPLLVAGLLLAVLGGVVLFVVLKLCQTD
jgi:serine/threonine-protein kinase